MSSFVENEYSPALPVAFSGVPAAVATLFMIWVMHSLIANEGPDVIPTKPPIFEVVRNKPKPIEFPTTEPLERPDDVQPPPDWHSPQLENPMEGHDLAWIGPQSIEFPEGNANIDAGGGAVVAYLKPQPIYPTRALVRGIEGYVDLAFDINASGATFNVRILEAQPPGVFEKAATNALKKWKYKVPVLDEVPQAQQDMMTRMTFAIES